MPDRVLRAMSRPTIDHRGPDFQSMTFRILEDVKRVFGTEHPVFIHPSSAHGAWEAALANTLSAGDTVLVFQQGHFAGKWAAVAERFGLEVRRESWDPRRALDAEAVADVLHQDSGDIKAVLVVHSETSTGVLADVKSMGEAVKATGHPALLMVDAVSSLAATDLRHDAWGLDVTVSGSQKGLMLPPGLSFVAVSPRALEAARDATLPRAYWRWEDQRDFNARGFFPYTPATNLLFGLEEALRMLFEEGLEAVFRRHARFAAATRRAVEGWGLEPCAAEASEASPALTAVVTPDGHDADLLRSTILERFDMSLGKGLGDFEGRLFRIGHLGDFNEAMLMGTLACVEMGLELAGVPHEKGGVTAAMEYLTESGEGGTE